MTENLLGAAALRALRGPLTLVFGNVAPLTFVATSLRSSATVIQGHERSMEKCVRALAGVATPPPNVAILFLFFHHLTGREPGLEATKSERNEDVLLMLHSRPFGLTNTTHR